MYRALILLGLAIFVVTPVADHMACTFCGPSAETTATAKPVPHTEDDCILSDGFERPSQSPDSESTHIHYCLLHATSIVLDCAYGLDFTSGISDFELKSVEIEDSYVPSFFHPPTAS